MGLGKTIQAISVAYIFKQEWPLLIVVPSSLKYPWIEDLVKLIPELDPRDINLVESRTDTMYDKFKFNKAHGFRKGSGSKQVKNRINFLHSEMDF